MGSSEIVSTIIHEFPYALYGSILVAVACAFLGVYIVARRVVFFGAVLTQVSVLGLAATFLPFLAMPHSVGSLALTLILVMILSQLFTSGKKIPRDAVLGFVFVAAIAARILVMQKAPKVEAAEVENLLRGDILFVTAETLWPMVGAFVVGAVMNLLFHKEFSFIAFDPETARTQGYDARKWDLVFYLLAGLIIAFATHMVGDLFVFGFLVVPPVAALLLARRVNAVFAASVLIGVLSPPIGLYLAFLWDFPSSPAIVGVACLFAALAYGVSLVRKH
ncbi:MAG TPA: metal ABC transporter permease [Bacteroidota bacterium]